MPTTFADNLHKFNRGAISRAVPSPAECSNPETLSTTREQGEEDRTRCNVPLRRINGGSRGGEGKEGEKRYGNNGLFALGISYNPPFLPLPCCFLRPQFIIFPSFSLLLFRFLSPPPVFDAAIEKRRMGRGGGIVAKVRYRCRRGDTGVARITVTPLHQQGESGLLRSKPPFPMFRAACNVTNPSSLWIPSNEGESFEDRRVWRMHRG